jgi:exoribonuclease-2
VEGKLVHGADGLDVADRVRVELIGTDVEQGHIDFVKANGGSQTTGRKGSEEAGS